MLAGGDQFSRRGPPREKAFTQRAAKHIAKDARVAAIAIRKGVDTDDFPVQPQADFVRRIGVVLYPKCDVIKRISDSHGDHIGRSIADIDLSTSQLSCPFPCFIEHFSVQLNTEIYR